MGLHIRSAGSPPHHQQAASTAVIFSCSDESTVAVHITALSVSGLEPQNSTLRKNSFPKEILWPVLETQEEQARVQNPVAEAL